MYLLLRDIIIQQASSKYRKFNTNKLSSQYGYILQNTVGIYEYKQIKVIRGMTIFINFKNLPLL